MTAAPEALLPVLVPLARMRAHPDNYRRHTDKQREHLIARLRKYGQYKNVTLARDFTLLTGHGMVEAMRAAGMTDAAAVITDLDPLEPDALALLAGDNEVERLAEDDDTLRTRILQSIGPANLLGTGYDADELTERVLALAEAARGNGAAPGQPYAPSLSPTIGNLDVTPEQVAAADAKLQSAYTTQPEQRPVICPSCAYEFYIDGKVGR